jgi:hypothetical protein
MLLNLPKSKIVDIKLIDKTLSIEVEIPILKWKYSKKVFSSNYVFRKFYADVLKIEIGYQKKMHW